MKLDFLNTRSAQATATVATVHRGRASLQLERKALCG
jgi:hypothetical protein